MGGQGRQQEVECKVDGQRGRGRARSQSYPGSGAQLGKDLLSSDLLFKIILLKKSTCIMLIYVCILIVKLIFICIKVSKTLQNTGNEIGTIK